MKTPTLPCARVADDGSVVLPPELARQLGLRPGTEVAVHVTRGGIWLRPDGFDPDQWWHWTPEWQEGEEEIERDRAAGIRGTFHESSEDFLASLESRMKPLSPDAHA